MTPTDIRQFVNQVSERPRRTNRGEGEMTWDDETCLRFAEAYDREDAAQIVEQAKEME
jgi:hypothetical protein